MRAVGALADAEEDQVGCLGRRRRRRRRSGPGTLDVFSVSYASIDRRPGFRMGGLTWGCTENR